MTLLTHVTCSVESCPETFGVKIDVESENEELYCSEHRVGDDPSKRVSWTEEDVQDVVDEINTGTSGYEVGSWSKVEEELFKGASSYSGKNEDYGDSWRKTGEILSQVVEDGKVELESPDDFVRMGLYTRRLDKLLRAFHGEFVNDEINNESVKDSHRDEMVYAAMAAVMGDEK
jgi:hypothetical protein